MDASPKNVREHIARSKFYLQRKDVLRSMRALAQALAMLVGAQIVGRERIEIGILMEEAVRLLMEEPVMKRAVPNGLAYKKGSERELSLQLTRMADVLEKLMEKARIEERRRRLAELDDLVLAGQTMLDQKEPVEARKNFRRAAELYGDEPGLYVDLGSRLMLAGLPGEAVEYFQKSIEAAPMDVRAYNFLAQCLDAQGEGQKAEDVIKATVKRFGPNEGMLARLAKGALERRKWDEALDYATGALAVNPNSREGRRCAEAASSHIFGDPKGYINSQERKTQAKSKPVELNL